MPETVSLFDLGVRVSARCPECRSRLYLAPATTSEIYLPAVFYKTTNGIPNDLPHREREVTIVACSGCEYTREVTR